MLFAIQRCTRLQREDDIILDRHLVIMMIPTLLPKCQRLGHDRLLCRHTFQKRLTGGWDFLDRALILDLWNLLICEGALQVDGFDVVFNAILV